MGIFSRYDGSRIVNEEIYAFRDKFNFIPVCPEQLGGLPTPREPSEIKGGRVLSKSGKDLTENYNNGAQETLRIAKMFNCRYAVLKDRSPSCGADVIYDGNFCGARTEGDGVTAALLKKNGITVIKESMFRAFLDSLD